MCKIILFGILIQCLTCKSVELLALSNIECEISTWILILSINFLPSTVVIFTSMELKNKIILIATFLLTGILFILTSKSSSQMYSGLLP